MDAEDDDDDEDDEDDVDGDITHQSEADQSAVSSAGDLNQSACSSKEASQSDVSIVMATEEVGGEGAEDKENASTSSSGGNSNNT